MFIVIHSFPLSSAVLQTNGLFTCPGYFCGCVDKGFDNKITAWPLLSLAPLSSSSLSSSSQTQCAPACWSCLSSTLRAASSLCWSTVPRSSARWKSVKSPLCATCWRLCCWAQEGQTSIWYDRHYIKKKSTVTLVYFNWCHTSTSPLVQVMAHLDHITNSV